MPELIDNIWWSISACSSFESTRMQMEDCTLHSTYVWNLNFNFYPFACQKCCESDSKSCILWQSSFSFCIAVQCLGEGFNLFPLYNAIKNWVVFSFCVFPVQQPAINVFKEIQIFLDANPSEVITIFLEDYTATGSLPKVFNASGLMKYWFPVAKMPKSGGNWPLLKDMISQNQRLIVFTSKKSKEASEGIAYEWNYVVENQCRFRYMMSDYIGWWSFNFFPWQFY